MKPLRIFKSKKDILTRPGDLGGVAMLVIGLSNMGYDDIDEVAHLLRYDTPTRKKTLVALVAEIHASTHPLVEKYLYEGLPRGIVSNLPDLRTVTCSICRHEVTTVPCLACSIGEPPAFTDDFPDETIEPEILCDALPGTLAKRAVISARLDRGEPLFHSAGDAMPSTRDDTRGERDESE